jgi:hypothetical protein
MKSAALALVLVLPLGAADRWTIEYHYDEDRSSFAINDLRFASPRRGVAVGVVTEGERTKPLSLVTSDGGKTWERLPLRETPLSLFFLDETSGWLVTDRGLWQTAEAGRTWTKLKAPKGILRVHFLDRQRGFAIGLEKAFFQTADGGKTWTEVPAVDQIKTRDKYTHLTWITFASPKMGVVTGYNRPPRRSDQGLPSWIDPDKAASRRELPNIGIHIETRDAGATWKAATNSLFGRITRIRFRPSGETLGLIEFTDFEYPSEVYRTDWRTGKMDQVYRQKTRSITDVIVTPDNRVHLAGVEVPGSLVRIPVPGKVKFLKSDDLKQWQEAPVDYRAVARRVIFALAGAELWAATDTGMLLKLQR